MPIHALMSTNAEKYHQLPHDDNDDDDHHVAPSMHQERRGFMNNPSSEDVDMMGLNLSLSSDINITPSNSQERETAPLSPSSLSSAPMVTLSSKPLQHISKSPRFKSDGVVRIGSKSPIKHTIRSPELTPRSQKQHTPVRDYDLDSDEEEDDLGRYSFDFNRALGNNNDLGPNGSRIFDMPQDNNKWTRRYSQKVVSPAKQIFGSIQKARTESRRKRMERLLALDATATRSKICFYTERCTICLSSYCDLFEIRGFAIVLMAICTYSIIVSNLGDDQKLAKRLMLGLGVPFIIIRCLWRPLSYYICRRERKVKNDQYMYNGPIELSSSDSSHQTRIPVV